jgi:ankyrin repeat protein
LVTDKSQSLPGQAAVLREPKHKKILEKVRDDTSSLRPLVRSSRTRPSSIGSRPYSVVGSTVFPFDREITSSDVYQRNGLLALEKRETQIAQTQERWKPVEDELPQRVQDFVRAEPLSPRSDTSVPLQWEKPQPFQRSVSSTLPRDRHLSRHSTSASSTSDTTLPVREKLSASRSGLRGFFRRSSQKVSSTSLSSDAFTPAGRRGSRRSLNDQSRSIDLSSPDGRSAPPIIRAAQEGSVVEVEDLLDQGANIEAAHISSGRTALAIAAHCGHGEVVSLLLQHRARMDVPDSTGMMPLHLAASRGHYNVVDLLIHEGVNIESSGPKRKTPLRIAVESGYEDVATLLLQSRAKLNARCTEQLTPLHVAAKSGDTAIAKLLITHGADVEAKDAIFMSPIHYASEAGHCSIIELLLTRKARIDCPGKSSMTPLMCACASGQSEAVTLLIKRKASVKLKSDGDMNVLHWSSYNGHDDILDLLLQKRVSIESRTTDGRTALHIAVLSRNFSAAELLLRRGAAVEAQCANHDRPLHYACEAASTDLVQLLLGSNANIEAVERNGRSPIHIATKVGSVKIVELLLNKGASIEARDASGERSLCLASGGGNLELVRLLLDKGASTRLKYTKGPSHEDSPLCLAAKYGHLPVVIELVNRKASIRQKDEHNWQPLRYAAFHGHPDIIQHLLDCGASVSGLSQGGWGFDMTASRIGFAKDVNEDRKAQVLDLLRAAEARERSLREAAAASDASAGTMLQQKSPAELGEDNGIGLVAEMPSIPLPTTNDARNEISGTTAVPAPIPQPEKQPSTLPSITVSSDASGAISRPPSPYAPDSVATKAPSRVDLDQLRTLTCNNCQLSGKQVPDLTCVECRGSVFRYNHTELPVFEAPTQVYEMPGSEDFA